MRSQPPSAVIHGNPVKRRLAKVIARVDAQWLALAVVLLAAVLFRVHDLSRTSISLDEAVSWKQARLPFFEMLSATAHDNYPPLHNLILHITIALFGDSELALRAPSALFGIATVGLIGMLGTVLWGRTTGLLAALFLAMSGYHVWYSTEARMYSLFAFTSTLFVYMVVQLACRPKWTTVAGCAAAGTALLYTHFYGIFVFVGVGVFVFFALARQAAWMRTSRVEWLIAQAVPIIVFLPWAIILVHRTRRVLLKGFWIPDPTGEFVLQSLAKLAGGEITLIIISVLAFLSVMNLGRGTHGSDRLVHRPQPDWQIGIVLTWLITPFIGGYLFSIVGKPILLDRYLICALPAGVLLAARGCTTLASHKLIFTLAVACVVFAAVPNLNYQAFFRLRPDVRAAMQEFAAQYRPSDKVIFVEHVQIPSQYYYRNSIVDSMSVQPEELSLTEIEASRLWIIIRDASPQSLQSLKSGLPAAYKMEFEKSWRHGPHLLLLIRSPTT